MPSTPSPESSPAARWPLAAVLVVDDEPGMRNFLEKTLASRVGNVQSAGSAEQADELVRRHRFDLIVLDVTLPGQSGIAWLRDLRQRGFAGEVVLITAFADLDTAIEALRAGASDFLLKPFRVTQVLNAVRRASIAVSRSAKAVISTTSPANPRCRSSRSQAMPLCPGSVTSSTIRSNRWRRTSSSACSADPALCTLPTRLARVFSRKLRMPGSSSTTSTAASGQRAAGEDSGDGVDGMGDPEVSAYCRNAGPPKTSGRPRAAGPLAPDADGG